MNNSLYSSNEYSTSLAVVGMAGRFPGTNSLEGFWQNIANKVSSIRQYSDEELLAAGVKPEDLQQPNYVRAGAVLENIEYFDTSFFGFTPREAEVLDPQFRIFLECVWEALEVAGYDLTTFDGLIGVFAGAGYKNYLLHHIQQTRSINETVSEFQIGLGQEADVLATLTSYKLNLKGPSVSVQSFCSTSLVGVHLACQSLLNYECDIAVAGASALNSLQMKGYFYEEGRIVSPDGICRPFDARAQGSVLGNGAAVVALKRLQDAIKDGDQIYSIIRGSAMNNDGNQRVSYTAPGLDGQASVIASALSYAGIQPETISYIEANGTGTKLGDAIELAAMIKAFGGKTQQEQFCAISSLKPNIGHLDRASGVAGLIKTTLAMSHHQLPPHLHYEQPNPEVDLTHSPFYVNTDLAPWPRKQTPRRAGINSFGLGGTNVHLVLEEAPEREPGSPGRPWQILPLSARSAWSLQEASNNLATHLKTHPEQALADVAYTLQIGRSAFNHRQFIIAQTTEEASVALEQASQVHQEHRDRAVALLFPDRDAGYRELGRTLYDQAPEFRETVIKCAQLLQARRLSVDLQALLSPESDQATELPQVAIFVIQYALAQLLLGWNIRPQTLLGYGPGAYVAACLAGVLSLEDGLTIANLMDSGKSDTSLSAIKLHAPQLRILSPMTGTWLTREQATSLDYWIQQGSQSSATPHEVETLLQNAELVLLEMGTQEILDSFLQQANSPEQQIISLCAQPSGLAAILTAVGKLWLAGVTIDWKRLFANERRLRVQLPTYPFERQRSWIDDPTNLNAIRQRGANTKKELNIADWFYLPYWEPSFPLVLPQKETEQLYLLFLDPSGLGQRVAQKLEHEGYSVISVEAGSTFVQHSDSHFSIRADLDEDYSVLFKALSRQGRIPEGILHCWNVTTEEAVTTPQSYAGFSSLLCLARAISASIYDAKIPLLVVSNHTQSVTGQELLRPEKTTILGACKVISQEYPAIPCRSIDLTVSDVSSWAASRMATYLAAECTAVSRDTTVAYRGNTRWVQRYQPVKLEQEKRNVASFRSRGIYLIVGGLSETGLNLAEYLAAKAQASIVLLDDAPFPPSNQWSTWLEQHPQGDPVSRNIQHLQALEAINARVSILSATLTDAKQMKQTITQIHQQFGALHGVLHLTGGADLQTIQDSEQADAHFRAKLDGLVALEQALQDTKLDFCVLFSSLTGVLGGLGCATDAALSVLTDAFAEQQSQISITPWMSIDWDPWRTRENEQRFTGTTIARFMLSPEEGADALSRIIASQWPHIVTSTGNLHDRLEQWVQPISAPQGSEAASLSAARPQVSASYMAPQSPTEQKIVEVWQLLLGFEQIGIHDNFFELHGHSLLGMQLISRLRQIFQVNIPLVKLFEGPTVAELAAVVEAIIIAEIESLDEEEARLLV